jgi:hypothetical protein
MGQLVTADLVSVVTSTNTQASGMSNLTEKFGWRFHRLNQICLFATHSDSTLTSQPSARTTHSN